MGVDDPSVGGEGDRMGLLTVILVDVASGGGRRRLSGCSGCCGWGGNSGHGGHRRGRGPVSSDLLVGFFQMLL